jgi:tRNA(Ile)-lysidine synthase
VRARADHPPLNNDGGFGGDGTSPPTLPFFANLTAWHASRRPAVAVSGGADSLCLALLARHWGDPLALIVDHCLRPESAAEAALTATRLEALGLPARILTLTGLAPGPALAARARAARYQALFAATREAGRVDLLLGHHRRDQAETVLLRQLSHSGAAGLAGMAGVTETRDIRLLRPLLGAPPGALRALLREAGLDWVEDPSNLDVTATRPRLRMQLNDPAGDGPSVRALAAAAASCAASRAAADRRVAAELAHRAAIYPEGYAILTPGPLSPAALGALIRCLTGAPYVPAAASLARLAAAPRPAVLAGLRLLPAGRRGEGWLLVREEVAMAAAIPAQPGALWDRRFLVSATEGEPGTIGALGADAAALRKHSPLPAAVLRTLPALRVNGVLVAVPQMGYALSSGPARMAVSFAPTTPASGAPFGACAPGDAEAELSPHLFG